MVNPVTLVKTANQDLADTQDKTDYQDSVAILDKMDCPVSLVTQGKTASPVSLDLAVIPAFLGIVELQVLAEFLDSAVKMDCLDSQAIQVKTGHLGIVELRDIPVTAVSAVTPEIAVFQVSQVSPDTQV